MRVSAFVGRCGSVRADFPMADAVSSAVLHPSGTVLATCSGQRRPVAGDAGLSESGEESEGDASSPASSVSSVPSETVFRGDNSLKIWAL